MCDMYRTGPLRFYEWQSHWKASDNDPEVSESEFNATYLSLRGWLLKRWNAHPFSPEPPVCLVWSQRRRPDRTHFIEIFDETILNEEFLLLIQEWVRTAPQWRVLIPTDDAGENVILIYPGEIRINPMAEKNIEFFLKAIQPGLKEAIRNAGREADLRWGKLEMPPERQ